MDTGFITQLISDIRPEYWYSFVFLGTFFLGENIIIASLIFAATRPIAFPGTVLAALLGTIIADLFWYLIATHVISKTRLKNILERKRTSTYLNSILRIIDRHPYFILLIIKFLVGIRILLSVSIVTRLKMPLRPFLFFDTLGSLLFIAILSVIGWFVGTGILSVSATHDIVTLTFLAIITLSVSLHLLSRALVRLLQKLQKIKAV